MEQFKEKLDEIIDFDIKEETVNWSRTHIKTLEDKYKLSLPEDYVFYLQNYGNDYIKDDYRFIPTVELSNKIRQKQFEIDSIYGLGNDENQIANKIKFYQDLLPIDLLPIADLPGGDLICMGIKAENKNKIYIWLHEMDIEDVFLVSNSFMSFIKDFKIVKVEKKSLDDVKLNLSSDLNDFLSNASKKLNGI